MLKENFDYDIAEIEKQQETEPEFAFVAERAEGFYLYDETGKGYLDLTANNDCMPLGYQGKNQNGFYESAGLKSKEAGELEKLVKETTGFENSCFFSEKHAALEFVKKIVNRNPEKTLLVSAVDRKSYEINGKEVLNLQLNCESAVKTFFNKRTEAVIVEISQVRDSFNIAEIEYLKLLKDYCMKNEALLVYDTCSVSPLRFGRGLFNLDETIKPDVLIVKNGLAAGNPLYMVSLMGDIEEVPEASGTFSSAYTEAVEFIQKQDEYKKLIEENSDYIEEKFQALSEEHISLADVIRCGMMFAVVTEIPSKELVKEAMNKGILVKSLNEYTVLLQPPYNITKEEIDRVVEIFNELLNEFTQYDRLV